VSTTGVITALAAGTATITATAGDKTGQQTITVVAPAGIKVNEVESNGGTPGDWAELYNPTNAAVDLSGWVVKDNDDTHIYTLPAGTTIAAGGYLTVEEADLGFGLGAPDAVRLYSKYGVTVDSYSWTAHAATTYGRCPDGTGAFTTTVASTKGAANSCPGSGPTAMTWPGPGTDVVTVDAMNAFTSNLSDLIYDPGATTAQDVLWGVRNGPGTIYRLLWNGTIWTEDATNGWSAGKTLHYPDGTGDPDGEGIAFAAASADGIYVSAERNNSNSGVSRNSILLFDPSQSGTTLTATHEWDLTADLPVTGANLGAEAITWIPDTYLVSKSFYDEKAGHAYVPSDYPNHGTGLFFVGLEANGMIYAYALNHSDNTSIASRRSARRRRGSWRCVLTVTSAICGRRATMGAGTRHRFSRSTPPWARRRSGDSRSRGCTAVRRRCRTSTTKGSRWRRSPSARAASSMCSGRMTAMMMGTRSVARRFRAGRFIKV
jgi:hypothetical protein